MSCKELSLSCLWSNKDVTTISILIGSNAGSFLLGCLLTIFITRFPRSKPQQSPVRRTSFIKIRPESTLYEQTVTSKPNAVDHPNSRMVPISPCSLSHTFVRHSIKPPMNMFNSLPSSSDNHWKLGAHRKEHPLMVNESAFGRRPSESDMSTVYGGASIENGGDYSNLFDPEKRRSVGGSSLSRDPGRRQSQSTYTSDSRTPFQIPIAGASAVQEPVVAAKDAGSYREYPIRPKRASTKYDVTYPLTRQRTLSSNSVSARPDLGADTRPSLSTSVVGDGSPQTRIMHPFSSSTTFEDNTSQHSHPQVSKHPLMPIVTGEALASSSSHPRAAEMESPEHQLSERQQAASFYQEHATRHLSLPQGAQLMTSPVLPESPSVIGGLDRNDFSFARGQPSKLR